MHYRKYLLVAINALLFLWSANLILFSEGSNMFLGLFVFVFAIFWILINVYWQLIYWVYFQNEARKVLVEMGYVALVFAPFFAVGLIFRLILKAL